MKFYTPTARKEYLRCPKRFYFRYLFKPEDPTEKEQHRSLRKLYGIRELAGHLIHGAIAGEVRAYADGNMWNYENAGKRCRERFLDVVCRSYAEEPGVLLDDLQLAEAYNGCGIQELRDDITFWRDVIPIMIENAWRACFTLGLQQSKSGYSLFAEHKVEHKIGDKTHHLVFDVMTQSSARSMVIDWKTHEIDNEDIYQVQRYLRCLHETQGIPTLRLFGFAVNLLTEEITSITYNPFPQSTGGYSASPCFSFPSLIISYLLAMSMPLFSGLVA